MAANPSFFNQRRCVWIVDEVFIRVLDVTYQTNPYFYRRQAIKISPSLPI